MGVVQIHEELAIAENLGAQDFLRGSPKPVYRGPYSIATSPLGQARLRGFEQARMQHEAREAGQALAERINERICAAFAWLKARLG